MRPCLALYMGVGGPNLVPCDCRAISRAQPRIVTLTYLRVFIIAQWPFTEFKFKPSDGEIKSPDGEIKSPFALLTTVRRLF